MSDNVPEVSHLHKAHASISMSDISVKPFFSLSINIGCSLKMCFGLKYGLQDPQTMPCVPSQKNRLKNIYSSAVKQFLVIITSKNKKKLFTHNICVSVLCIYVMYI